MSNTTQQIVNKAWNFAHVLRDDGLSYMAYTEQITFLLFLKMSDELTKPPYNRRAIVSPELGRPSLLERDGDELEVHYRRPRSSWESNPPCDPAVDQGRIGPDTAGSPPTIRPVPFNCPFNCLLAAPFGLNHPDSVSNVIRRAEKHLAQSRQDRNLAAKIVETIIETENRV